ncbi:hypothetical protein IEQ34_017372 [Dendrobium chrysotoxum]|uniref:Uncharacterized protein n=1 Tax=Dendrobium chrysotoxum TaxID=161865 RepID=A0AAV7GCD9_DENCH|nr:hypothetical protein IEQ34_017372 [Dendrobium chrysotoxum]
MTETNRTYHGNKKLILAMPSISTMNRGTQTGYPVVHTGEHWYPQGSKVDILIKLDFWKGFIYTVSRRRDCTGPLHAAANNLTTQMVAVKRASHTY